LHSRFHFEDSPIRAGLERIISPKIRRDGYLIWHNRKIRVLHDTSETFRDFYRQALGRGHHRMILWQQHSEKIDRLLLSFGFASIPIYFALLLLRDFYRLCRANLREPSVLNLLHLPLHFVFLTFFHTVGMFGMARVFGKLKKSGQVVASEPTYGITSS